MSSKDTISRNILLYLFGVPYTRKLWKQFFHNQFNHHQLLEPDEAQKCRRNVLALSGIVILAGIFGKGPESMNWLGLEVSSKGNVIWFCLSIIIIQVYWYGKRFLHMRDDAEFQVNAHPGEEGPNLNATRSSHLSCIPRRADFFSSIATHVVTVLSWIFLVKWAI